MLVTFPVPLEALSSKIIDGNFLHLSPKKFLHLAFYHPGICNFTSLVAHIVYLIFLIYIYIHTHTHLFSFSFLFFNSPFFISNNIILNNNYFFCLFVCFYIIIYLFYFFIYIYINYILVININLYIFVMFMLSVC